MRLSAIKLSVLSALAAVAFLSSCASTTNVALSSKDRAAMKGKTVALTKQKMPAWGVITPSAMAASSLTGGIGGAIAGNIANEQGAKELSKHKVEDVAVKLAEETLAYLIQRTGAKMTAGSKVQADVYDPKEIAQLCPNADYILDVRTLGWMGIYYPMALTKYRMIQGIKMRVIERESGKVIAEGFSSYAGKDKENAPNFDGIYENGAAFLKSELKKSSDQARGIFKDQL